MDLLKSFHFLATLLFILGSTAVGVKLLLLSKQTKGVPELFLGGAIFLAGGIGYGVLIASYLARGTGAVAPEDVSSLGVVLTGVGRTIHYFGVTLYLAFTVYVFRRDATWAYVLAGVAMLVLWLGFLAWIAQGYLRVRDGGVGSFTWFCQTGVLWSYQLWNAVEALRYHGLMRRRAAIGLSDPLVANRFLLWGMGSLFAALAIWVACIQYLFVDDVARLDAIMPALRISTAALGAMSVTCSLLAFLPPSWYRRRILAHGGAAASPAAAH